MSKRGIVEEKEVTAIVASADVVSVGAGAAVSSSVNKYAIIPPPRLPATKKLKVQTTTVNSATTTTTTNNASFVADFAVSSGGGSSNSKTTAATAPSADVVAAASSSYDVVAAAYYDSDEEAPPPTQNDHLNWRLPPEESHSDWKIEIITTATTTNTNITSDEEKDNNRNQKQQQQKSRSRIDSYYIHKHMIAVGSKKCEYFSRLFKSNNFVESSNATSTIKLDVLAANAFPIFLDYMYSPNVEEVVVVKNITTSNATALHYLSKYFDNRRLRWHVKKFITNDINIDTCSIYYCHAKRFHDEKILFVVSNFCTTNICSIPPNNPIFDVIDLDFMINIVNSTIATQPSSSTMTTTRRSKHLSRLIAKFCLNHENSCITIDSFHELTNSNILPVIDCSAAIELMAVENRLLLVNNNNDGRKAASQLNDEEKNNKEKREDHHSQLLLSNLQERCSKALADHIGSIDLSSSHSKQCIVELNSNIFADILSNAQREIHTLQTENQRLVIENHSKNIDNLVLKNETSSRKTTNEIFVAQNQTLNNEIKTLTEEKQSLLEDIQGLIPIPPDGMGSIVFHHQQQQQQHNNTDDDRTDGGISTNSQQEKATTLTHHPQKEMVMAIPNFDRNRSLTRQIYYQSKPFTNIFGEKEPGRCYPMYYYKKGG